MAKKRYQVFVSSTYKDLKDERREVIHTLMQKGCIPTGMELFPSVPGQWHYIKKAIADCDYFLLLIGGRYGTTDDSDLSFTEKEFNYAVAERKPVIALLRDLDSAEKPPAAKREVGPTLAAARLDEFRKRVSKDNLVPRWDETSDIKIQLVSSLDEHFEQESAQGWIRNPGPYAVLEKEAEHKIRELVSEECVKRVDLLGHSGSTRSDTIKWIVKRQGKPVRLLMPRLRHTRKPEQRSQIKALVHEALKDLEGTGLFELKMHPEHASLRLTLLRGEDLRLHAAVVGWYSYRQIDRVVRGASNPSVYVLEADNPLLTWAADEFQTKWNASEDVTLANYKQLFEREEGVAQETS